MAKKIETHVALTGILSDPKAANEFKDALLVSLQGEAKRLESVVKAQTPVYSGPRLSPTNPPPGSLRDGVTGSVKPTKRGLVVKVAADKAKRKGTPGDSGLSQAKRDINARKVADAIRKGKKLSGAAQAKALAKGSRRYGPVPYGVFVNNETGFLDDTVLAQQGQTLRAVNDAVGRWVHEQNAKPVVTLVSPPPAS